MTAEPGLDGGLLVGGDDVVVAAQSFAFPFPGVQIEHPAGLDLEVGVSGEDPRSVPPRSNGVIGEPPPDRGPRDLGHDAAGGDLAGDVGHVQP